MTQPKQREASFEEKTLINARVRERYDELRKNGKHGYFETLFKIVQEERQASSAAMLESLQSPEMVEELTRMTALMIAGQTKAAVTSNGFAIMGDQIIDCNELSKKVAQAIVERIKS